MAQKLWKFTTSKYVLAFLSSTLFLLTLPPFKQSWLGGIAIVPLLLLIQKENSFWKNFLLGTFAWAPYCVVTFYWCVYYSVWNYLDVVMSYLPFLGLFCGLVGLTLKKFPRNLLLNFLAPPVIWLMLSFLYDLTPLGSIGTQAIFYQPLEWMQIARVFGVYGVMFLFLLVNTSIALIFKFKSGKRFIPLIVSIFFLTANFFWGKRALADQFVGTEKIALIQHNLPFQKEWWLKNQGLILSRYRLLALDAAKEKPSLIIFPSYSLPFDAYRNSSFFEELAKETRSFILVSTYIPQIANRPIYDVGLYEVALLFSPEGKLVALDKAVQAPPFRNIHEVLAKETKLLPTPFGKMGILLCFEDTVPRRAKEEVKKGAQILVAISNIGHFNKTFLPTYHLYQDQLRAIETNRFVIRVSANGYSAIIDPRGRVIKRTELGKQGILYGQVKTKSAP